MPTYDYRCPEGHDTQLILSISEYVPSINCPDCKKEAPRYITSNAGVYVDNMPAYQCVVTGETVTSRRQRNEIMKRHDLVEMGDSKGVHC